MDRQTEVTGGLEVGVSPGLPVHGSVKIGITHRWSKRGQEPLEAVLSSLSERELVQRLESNEELDALLARALNAAANSSLAGKRRLLGKLVTQAALDDAEVDESSALIGVLEQIDAPHARCLEAIARAEAASEAAGELEATHPMAEKPSNPRVQAVADQYHVVLLRQLVQIGLIDGSVTWGDRTRITGLTKFGLSVLEDLRRAGAE